MNKKTHTRNIRILTAFTKLKLELELKLELSISKN
jgi:hypothetical protein